MFESDGGLRDKLPVSLYKLAHHGAQENNRLKTLQHYLGDTTQRTVELFEAGAGSPRDERALAVRIRNATKEPQQGNWVLEKLEELETVLWDTRESGDLWVKMERPERSDREVPLGKITYSNDPNAIGLPVNVT
jgi:hypothetical protein